MLFCNQQPFLAFFFEIAFPETFKKKITKMDFSQNFNKYQNLLGTTCVRAPISSPAGMWNIGQRASDDYTSMKAATGIGLSPSGCWGLRGWLEFPLLVRMCLSSKLPLYKVAVCSKSCGNTGSPASKLDLEQLEFGFSIHPELLISSVNICLLH